MTKVTVDEVREVLDRDSDRVTIVDSRSADAWGSSDVKAAGAIRVPPDDAEKHISDINRDEYVLTYCTWPNEHSSTRVALVLEEHGIADVHPLLGGFDAWRQAGLPVEPK